MRHFLGFRALHEIQKLMREKGSKCATFAQKHNIWTHCPQHGEFFSPPTPKSAKRNNFYKKTR